MSSGFHPTASISTRTDIQDHVLIGALTVIEDGVQIDDVTSIGAHVFIGKDVKIGARCAILAGCILGTGLIIKDDVKIFEGVLSHGLVVVEDGAEIGAGAILVGGEHETLIIGKGAKVYTGELVVEDVPSPIISETDLGVK